MAKKLWSMSTTVRNPYRLKDFLVTLKDLDGAKWDQETQIRFQILLIRDRNYKPTPENLSEAQNALLEDPLKPISEEAAAGIFHAKGYVDAPMRGRNSFAPLQKMGLANVIGGKIKITDLGRRLLREEIGVEEFAFMSLLKWQYPNPTSQDFKGSDGYNTKPFVTTLRLIREVNALCAERGIKAKGISKEEFGIFALSLIHYQEIPSAAAALLDYRAQKDALKENQEKKAFTEEAMKTYLGSFANATPDNIRDYADNAIRYFRLTRYVYIRGGGYYIDLEPRRMLELQKLFEIDSGCAKPFTKSQYIEYLSNYDGYPLPWKNREELERIAKGILNEIHALEIELSRNETVVAFGETDDGLERQIKELRDQRTALQNLKIKRDYADLQKIDETIDVLQNIRNQPEKPSIALEKWANIALQIINDAKLIRPNCPVGDDNEPTFTAPGNVADIECYYDGFAGICEVTMLTGRDQWYNEGQPVQRHLRDFEEKHPDAPSYCLFVSPQLHRDTANTFWTAVRYEYEGDKQKIVPLSITQLTTLLKTIKKRKAEGKTFVRSDLKRFYDQALDLTSVKNSAEWMEQIKNLVDTLDMALL